MAMIRGSASTKLARRDITWTQAARSRRNLAPPVAEKLPIILTFDDGKAVVATDFQTPATDNSCKLTAFCIPSYVGATGYMTAAQVNAFHTAGHEVASHTYSHLDDLDAAAESIQEDEMRRGIEGLEEIITDETYRCRTMAYPYHKHDAGLMQIARKYYEAARDGYTSGAGDNTHPPTGSNRLYTQRLLQCPTLLDFIVWTGRTPITGIVGAAGTVTVACAGHPFVNGDTVVIDGTVAFNGSHATITKTGADEFTYASATTGNETPAAAYASDSETVIRAAVHASIDSYIASNYPIMVIGHTLANTTAAQLGYICEVIAADTRVQSMTFAEFSEFIRLRNSPDSLGDVWSSPYNAWLVWTNADDANLTVTYQTGGVLGGTFVRLVNTGIADVNYRFYIDRQTSMPTTMSAFIKSNTGVLISAAASIRCAGDTDATPDDAPVAWTRIQYSSTPATTTASEFAIVVKAGKSCDIDLVQVEMGVIVAGAYEKPYPLVD